MPEALIAEPEVIAPAAAPAAPAVEKPSVVTFERDAAKVTPDVLSGLTPKWSPPKMFARPNATPAAVEPAPAAPAATEVPAAPAAAPEPAPAAPVAPVVDPAAPPAVAPLPPGVAPIDPNSPDFPKNWKQKATDAKEALVFQLHKTGVALQDAVREVYGEQAPAAPQAAVPAAPPAPPLPDPVAQADQHITGLAAQVAELEAKIDEVAADDPKTALKLTRQQSDLKLELATAKTQRETMAREIEDRQVSRAVETHRQLEDRSLTEMYGRYPKLNEKSSEERAAFNVKVAQMEKDPAYGPRFRDTIPGWPLMVAQMVDAEKGWSRTATPPPGAPAPAPAPAAPPMNQPNNPLAPRAVVAPPTVPPVRATSAELLSTSASPGSATPVLDAKTFWKDSADVTPDQLLALMKNAPVDPRLTRTQKNDPRRFDSP